MSDDATPDAPRGPHAPSPRKPRDDYWEFINLSGKDELVDSAKLGCPLTARSWFEEDGVWCCVYREEYLYPAPGSRHILIFLPDHDPELVRACPWPARELSAEDAALWHMLSEHKLPDSLQPVDLRDPVEDASSRLNRDWNDTSADQLAGSASPPFASRKDPPTKRRGRVAGVNKIDLALNETASRLKDGHSVAITVIAKVVGCGTKNLRRSKRFMRSHRDLVDGMARAIRHRGTKADGITEAWVDPRGDRDEEDDGVI